MVSVVYSLSDTDTAPPVERICVGLSDEQSALVHDATEFAVEVYGDGLLGTGEPILQHASSMALTAVALKLDADARAAALLFAVCHKDKGMAEQLAKRYPPMLCELVLGLQQLNGLRVLTRVNAQGMQMQSEILRKMMLGMVQDVRVVLLRLASRVQTLRYLVDHPGERRDEIARESLQIYAPLANRLGVWPLKWELEDLSFRYLEPEAYRRIAGMLDERRSEREAFIADAIERLTQAIAAIGIKADVTGRPKHIFSIFSKMRAKGLDFSQLYDIRAVRVLVNKVSECYRVLDIVNEMWTPIATEYDDYISRPKANNYQSLHTAVRAADGRALEVQIRTHEMHRHAELGVAAHWRYKEGAQSGGGSYDEKIALLRSLLSWRDAVADSGEWARHLRRVSLDDTIYVMTPQGRVIDLPHGATPVDFAYRVHSQLGHRCRGAKVDGQLVTLNTALQNGQTVEILTVKEGGPSRDWLNAEQGYVTTSRARSKIKQYFTHQFEEELIARGRALVTRELQREGQTQHGSIDGLATKLGFTSSEAMFAAAGRGEVSQRAMHTALRETPPEVPAGGVDEVTITRPTQSGRPGQVLVEGVGKLLTSLSRCCKPTPPDAIQGFVTRGRGVSVHRVDCADFQQLVSQHPERVIEVEWSSDAYESESSRFAADLEVRAADRQGLLRDVSDALSRERVNVLAVNTLTRRGEAKMRFTVEVHDVMQIQRLDHVLRTVPGVHGVRRV